MTGEETKRLKEEFSRTILDKTTLSSPIGGAKKYREDEQILWNWIKRKIITPYEKQLEQVERKLKGVLETPDNGDCACNVHSKLKNYVCKVCGCPVNDVCYEHFELKSQNTHTK